MVVVEVIVIEILVLDDSEEYDDSEIITMCSNNNKNKVGKKK